MTFDDLLHRPRWMLDALCREYPEWSWFPISGQPARKIVDVCERCTVRAECADYGHDESYGIWGGVSTSVRLRQPAA